MAGSGESEDSEVTGPDDADDGTDSLRTRLTEWVFLTGNRWVLAAGILAVFLAVLVAIEFRTNSSGQQLVPLFYLASAIVGGNFTLLTIIISISQLVISRQLSAPGELEEQIENTTAYRDASVKLVDKEVPPPTPAAFLDVLLHGVRDAAEQLDSQRENIASDDAVTAIDRVLDPLRDQLDQSIHHLERDDVSIFEALVSTLDTNYSEDIHQIWRLEHAYENEITPEAKRCLEELVTRLKQIDVARQYLKTVYIQEELSRLSRDLMYIGIPAILVGLTLMELFISTNEPLLSPQDLSIITPVFTTIGAAPLALLFAYVLRLSVVSQRTAAITPFTTPTQETEPMETVSEEAGD